MAVFRYKTVKARSGQNVIDVAIQHCGTIESAFVIAAKNNINPVGMCDQVQVPMPTDEKVTDYYKNHKIYPASIE